MNPDPSSFNSLSLESLPENGKGRLFVSQVHRFENELDTPVEEVERDTDYLAARSYVSAVGRDKLSADALLCSE